MEWDEQCAAQPNSGVFHPLNFGHDKTAGLGTRASVLLRLSTALGLTLEFGVGSAGFGEPRSVHYQINEELVHSFFFLC